MFNVIFVLIGTFIGAGFASGKEVFNFFTIYSFNSLISVLVLIFKHLLINKKSKNEKINIEIIPLKEKIVKKLKISFPDEKPAPTKVPIKTKTFLNIKTSFINLKIFKFMIFSK